jgi:phenylacetate-coenzyme A ligase PaaK-like adenylate-forming protein
MNPPDLENLFIHSPYSLLSAEKRKLLLPIMIGLEKLHREKCHAYKLITDAIGMDPKDIDRLEELPFIPSKLFKEIELCSVPKEEIFKTMTSSGTSSNRPSKIFLDKYTAATQTKVLSNLMKDFLGAKRRPMLIIDSPDVIQSRNSFSARGAGILGFSMYGKDVTYALDANMNLNIEAILGFAQKYKSESVFVFGFTFMIWKYFIEPLQANGIKVDLDGCAVLHGGGWKKLQDHAVSSIEFNSSLNRIIGAKEVSDYYGMVEQTGSLYIACSSGNLHAPIYSDVIIRRSRDFSVADVGERGLVQVLSVIPGSYPGHSLITEDIGVLLGEDDCGCGRNGKYFMILGRALDAEIKGCSDTFTEI